MSKKPIKPKEPPKQKTITQEYLEEHFVGETINLEDFTKRIVSLGFLPKDISMCFETGYDYDSYTQVSIFVVKENIIPDDEYKVIIKKYEEDLKKYKKDLFSYNKECRLFSFSSFEKDVLKELVSSIILIPSSRKTFLALAKSKVKNSTNSFSKALEVLDSVSDTDVNMPDSYMEYLSLLKKKLKIKI